MEYFVLIEAPVIDEGRQQGGKLPMPGILNDVICCRRPGKSIVVCEHACIRNLKTV
jgi:hypothetical protein